MLPFRDHLACERARVIPRDQIAEHPNPDFSIAVFERRTDLYQAFADDLVDGIRQASSHGQEHVVILPVGPVPQYRLAVDRINRERISLRHVVTFNMDEYANEDGDTPPSTWPGSFEGTMRANFFLAIDPELRPLEENVHFPNRKNISSYSTMIADRGGADVCYGGIGWSGHIAFWEPHLGAEFDGDLEAFRSARARFVELHPMTIMQNALHSFGGDWSWVPPHAFTVGPLDILSARRRSFWLDGDLGGGVSWQRFIARLACHGPLSEFVPASFLQEGRSDVSMLAAVADDVAISMA